MEGHLGGERTLNGSDIISGGLAWQRRGRV